MLGCVLRFTLRVTRLHSFQGAIAFYSSGMHSTRRVQRLQPAFREHGWTIVVITSRLGIWFSCRLAGVPCLLTRRPQPADTSHLEERQLVDSSGLASDGPGLRLFLRAVWAALTRASHDYPLRALALWGINPADDVVRAFGRERGLPVLHFEIGNVEPKTFVDFEGVNAQSRVAQHPEILDSYDLTEDEVAEWRSGFIARKRRQTSIPQQSMPISVNPWFLVDKIGNVALRIPQPAPLSLSGRLTNKVSAWRRRLQHAPSPTIPATPFVFLPLQVSRDANLRLFSTKDNLDAIAFAAGRAALRNCLLVIKPHPAEDNASLMERITELCRAQGYVLSSANTAELILGAEEVVTINSTVGLEAKLMGKPVTSLGRSVYERFTDRQAAAYAMRHLIPFFPFGTEPAAPEVAATLIAMIEREAAGSGLGTAT